MREMLNNQKNRIELVRKSVPKSNYSLPPNVNGQCRGRLSLCLQEIHWLSDGPSNFDSIHTKAIWWGDAINSSAILRLRNKPIRGPTLKKGVEYTSNVIHYEILTKLKLFKSYLARSGGVELRFTSGTSNIPIGSAIAPIPMQLIKSIDKHQNKLTTKMQKFNSKCHIKNSQNKIIGKITIEYDLLLCGRPFDGSEFNCEIFSNDNLNHINVVKKNAVILPKEKKVKTKKSIVETPKSVKMSSKGLHPNPLMDYLTGRALTDHERDQAIKAMETISPSESLIDLLTIDLDCLSLQRPHKIRSSKLSSFDQVDSIRTHIYELTLTRAGVREILNENGTYSSGSFVVDVNLDSNLSMDIGTTFISEVSHIFTSMSDSLPPPVNFDKYSIQKLNKIESSLDGMVHLTYWYRDVISNRSRYFGLTKIPLADIMQGTDFTYKRQCPIRTSQGGVIVGAVMVKIELGCRELHFGSDYINAMSMTKSIHTFPLNFEAEVASLGPLQEPCSYNNEIDCDAFVRHQLQMEQLMVRSCVHDEQHTDRNTGNASIPAESISHSSQSHQNQQQLMNSRLSGLSNNNHALGMNDSPAMPDDTLQGLFYVGQCSSLQPISETLLICRPFWTNDVLVTESYRSRREDNCYLNYLEMFSVLSNDQLNKATKHNFMNIELWQRESDQVNNMVGIAKVSLHQFFIAFNNAHIRNHVTKQKIPVISIDGWVTFSSIQGTSDVPIGTVQVILAVGTSEQIAKFKISKSLTPCKIFSKMSPESFPLERRNAAEPRAPNIVNRPIQVPQNEPNPPLKSSQSQFSDDRQANLAAMLSNFIDNLALKLPERNAGHESRLPTTSSATTQTTNNGSKTDADTANHKNLRHTSELLDELHKALSIAPTPAQQNNFQCKVNDEEKSIPDDPDSIQTAEQTETISNATRTMFRIHIEIDCALHLPLEPNQGTEPTVYVSFEAFAPNVNVPNSIVYTTDVIECSCSPQWNKQYEVSLPVDFLTDDQKRFTLHIWRKSIIDDDVIIGDASIDLTVLVACLPSIDGWFNIIHSSGSMNGQIKVQIKPNASDLAPYISEHNASQMDQIQENTPMNMFLKDFDDSALSRALKRKFTELEEITQRLRARLFDVTGGGTGDSDDQFESDLNTIPDES